MATLKSSSRGLATSLAMFSLKSTVSHGTVRRTMEEGHLGGHIEPDTLVCTGEPSPGERAIGGLLQLCRVFEAV